MGRHFFTGGIMPSRDLLLRFQEHLRPRRTWDLGRRPLPEKRLRAWLKNMDAHREELLPILGKCYGRQEAERWFQRWRIFFIACEELWGFDDGQEWVRSPLPAGVSAHPDFHNSAHRAKRRTRSGPP